LINREELISRVFKDVIKTIKRTYRVFYNYIPMDQKKVKMKKTYLMYFVWKVKNKFNKKKLSNRSINKVKVWIEQEIERKPKQLRSSRYKSNLKRKRKNNRAKGIIAPINKDLKIIMGIQILLKGLIRDEETKTL
jgi:hypothetical protein